MTVYAPRDALLLAASELLPGESRDLADLIADLPDLAAALADPSTGGRHRALLDHIADHLDEGRVSFWQQRLDALAQRHPRVRLVAVSDAGYPATLRAVYDRPPFLFVDGTVHPGDARAVAIVGSRAASSIGRDQARELAAALASRGFTIVAGLAEGIDTAAHRGAIDARGRTFAVLGTGIDKLFPIGNAGLAEQVRDHGALLSQFRPGSPPTKSTFPIRNAVISGLSLVSVLMEASERSGTRSEAEAALRHRRPVLLWRPTMGDQVWVRRFTQNPGVQLVDDVAAVAAAAAAEPPQAMLEQ